MPSIGDDSFCLECLQHLDFLAKICYNKARKQIFPYKKAKQE